MGLYGKKEAELISDSSTKMRRSRNMAECKSNPLSYKNSSKIFIYNFDHIFETSQLFILILNQITKSNAQLLGNEESF